MAERMATAAGSVLNPTDLGRLNRARVLRALQVQGPLSRSDIAKQLGISRGSVGTIVQPLLDDGLLVELPKVKAPNGKPPKPLWFADRWRLGAVFVAPGSVVVASVSLDGRLLKRSEAAFSGIDSFRARLIEQCEQLLDPSTLVGIGVGSAGAVDVPSGTILENYRIPALNGLALAPLLSERFGVPAYVDHHPRVQAIGDLWFGVGRGMTDFASVYTGDVLGVGVIAGGRVMHGPRGAGGEIGHMVVERGGRGCLCGQHGCWYTVASLSWLRQRADELGLADAADLTSARLAGSTERLEQQLLAEYADNIALGVANLEQVLGIGTYVLHGDAAGAGEDFTLRVAEQIAMRIPRRRGELRVIAAPDPDEATILGAAGLVMFRSYDLRL